MHHFILLFIIFFGVFGGMRGEKSCNVLLLFIVLWVPISATLLQEGDTNVVTWLHVLGAKGFSSFLLFARVDPAITSRSRTHESETEIMHVLFLHISW
jgi:hypothetical protein